MPGVAQKQVSFKSQITVSFFAAFRLFVACLAAFRLVVFCPVGGILPCCLLFVCRHSALFWFVCLAAHIHILKESCLASNNNLKIML